MEIEYKHPISLLCSIAGISRASYYRYKNKPLDRDTSIEDLIVDIYNKSGKRAGYRTIKQILKIKYNLVVNHKKVLRIMQAKEIRSIVRQKFRKPKEETMIKENILNRDFKADRPGEKFATDITYIPTQRKMAYLCTVIDLFNNEPAAWKISDTQDKSLSIDTIKILSGKYDLRGSIIHSDQGIHYTNKDYVSLLKELEVNQSMSRKGNCWDNAKAENFFSHYKCESIYLMKKKLKDTKDVEEITKDYIDYYTNFRPQKKLGGMPPSLYKKVFLENQKIH
jgi:transposase InsO family protein